MSGAADFLRSEGAAWLAILRRLPEDAFDRPTVCSGWSVRDVLAHCSAALRAAATGTLHRFTPEDNERDVAERRPWPLSDVLRELEQNLEAAARAVAAASGALDGLALGEWVHGGDVRDALGLPEAYTGPAIGTALELISRRSQARGAPRVAVTIEGHSVDFGAGEQRGTLVTDAATFVRLVAGRRPDPARYELSGVRAADLVLFH